MNLIPPVYNVSSIIWLCTHSNYYLCYTTGPPKLKDNVEVSITEGVGDISVDLGMYQTDRVEAAFVSLSKTKGQLASMGDISVSLRNTTLYFENVTRQHSGRYILSLTNDCENGGTVEARTEVGSITLNVLCELCQV